MYKKDWIRKNKKKNKNDCKEINDERLKLVSVIRNFQNKQTWCWAIPSLLLDKENVFEEIGKNLVLGIWNFQNKPLPWVFILLWYCSLPISLLEC